MAKTAEVRDLGTDSQTNNQPRIFDSKLSGDRRACIATIIAP
ncbi:hypothetical protein [Sinorhizobium terangae]|nr:hypothetical protein [Sinorhizobium terangae]WFU51676.1 hypothetical protein QA637_29760 [Sinorhizobium terangae]